MTGKLPAVEGTDPRLTVGILSAVEQNEAVTQRVLSRDLGVAVGLVNIYFRRCVKKGLIKVTEAPKRRFAYYLTPRGFSEKSRLTAEYLSSSFDFFRSARADCRAVLAAARTAGWSDVVLLGASDLTEICVISAADEAVRIAAVVDGAAGRPTLAGATIVADAGPFAATVGGAVLCDMRQPAATYRQAVAQFGSGRVLVPHLLKPATVDRESHAS